MRIITVLAVSTGLFLAACGSSGGSAVESATATGEVAGVFTGGVEIRVNNAGSKTFYVWSRRYPDWDSTQDVYPSQARNFYFETFSGNDLELAMSTKPRTQAGQTVEIDGVNPPFDSPKVTIDGKSMSMGVGDSATFSGWADGRYWTATATREGDRGEGDRKGYKFFNIDVRWD